MKDEIVIKRDWVKKVGIVFLALMLLLTLFSNTIMNASLPEVYTASINSGTISKEISGTGTAKAVSSYDITLSETRKIKEVLISEGQTVEKGDVLFRLDGGASAELTASMDALENLQFQKEKMLVAMGGNDYATAEREILKVREEIDRVKSELFSMGVTSDELSNLTQTIKIQNEIVAQLENELTSLESKLSDISYATDNALLSLDRQIEDLKSQISNANGNDVENPVRIEDLRKELERLREDYSLMLSQNPNFETLAPQITNKENALKAAEQHLAELESNGAEVGEIDAKKAEIEGLKTDITNLKKVLSDSAPLTSLLRQIEDKEKEINRWQPYLDSEYVDTSSMKKQLERLKADYSKMVEDNKEYKNLTEIKQNIQSALKDEPKKIAPLSELSQKKNSLDDLVFSLEQQKTNDNKSILLENLDYQKLLKDIAKQEKEVSKIQIETVGTEIKAVNAGKIITVDGYPGMVTAPNVPLAKMETTEQGYVVEITVSKKESEIISIGDIARTNEPNISATLIGVNSVPNSFGEEKNLTFSLDGEVVSDESYVIEFEAESNNYDKVIPKTALHFDSVGYFVYAVDSKNTPFGSRYQTKRVTVEVLDEGTQLVAIKSEELQPTNDVITSASMPISDKSKVRMSYE